MSQRRILIAGVGNIFLGDDALGVEVARRLAERDLPRGVDVVDFGIRGMDLALELLKPHHAVILIDAAPRGSEPGTLHALAVAGEDVEDKDDESCSLSTHNLDPVHALRLARTMGGPAQRVFLVGCEPVIQEQDMSMDMSAPVAGAVEEAVGMVERMARRLAAELTRDGPDRSTTDSQGEYA